MLKKLLPLMFLFASFQSSANLIIEDFEGGLPASGVLATNPTVPIGGIEFSGAGGSISLSQPTSISGNTVLEVEINSVVPGFAGYLNAFADTGAGTYQTEDWSGYSNFGFWFFGTGTGSNLYFDILDDRSNNPTTDDAERFTVNFDNDFSGWQKLDFAFTDFLYRDVGFPTVNDGSLSLENMSGWALGALNTPGTERFYLDDIQLCNGSCVTDGEPEPDLDIAQVPEPSILALMAVGLIGVGFARRLKA